MKTIYKVLTGVDEAEFYTFKAPTFDEENHLVCKEVFQKLAVDRLIVNRTIKSFYPSEIEDEKVFDLKDGVVIKIEDEALGWLDNTEITAQEDLDKKELLLYRELIPKIQSPAGIDNSKKNFLIQ